MSENRILAYIKFGKYKVGNDTRMVDLDRPYKGGRDRLTDVALLVQALDAKDLFFRTVEVPYFISELYGPSPIITPEMIVEQVPLMRFHVFSTKPMGDKEFLLMFAEEMIKTLQHDVRVDPATAEESTRQLKRWEKALDKIRSL